MASVICRKATNVPADKPRVLLYWTGKEWVQDAAKALAFEQRSSALPEHEKLVKGQQWPKDGGPVVVDR